MSGPKAGPDDAWVHPFWLNKQEIEHQKSLYRDLSHTVNLLKFDLAAVATGLTLIKADFTLFKVDEKGITLRGKQLATFPWADKKKSLEERIEMYHKGNLKRQEKIDRQIAKLTTTRDAALGKESSAKGSTDKSAVFRIRTEMSGLDAKANRIDSKVKLLTTVLSNRTTRVNKLQVKLDALKKKEEEAKTARRAVKDQTTAANKELTKMRREIRTAQRSVADFSRQL
ncbi:hypothetical protein ACOKM5_21640 [Streptomyces sp. BH097]|uniref:hypothetical protein n=1 Tax=unclassified Streptomyces TaxID=2593676 RepID=UPI003BB7BFFF